MRNRLRRVLTIIVLFISLNVSVFAQPDSTAQTPSVPMIDFSTTPKAYVINNITVSGVNYRDPQVVANLAGLMKGDTIMLPSEYIASIIQKMWKQGVYSDIQIQAQPVGDSVNVAILLKERPTVLNWNVEGIRKGQKSDLFETLNLKKGRELSDFLLNSSKDAIRKYFREKGFYNTEVSYRIENDTTMRNVVNVTFVIDKNDRVKIGDIVFEGNNALTDRQLRSSLKKTHKKSINIFKNTKLKEKEYEADKENLIDFYNSKGYRNATIITDSIYPISPNRIGISITVEEGNKFYYRNVSWTGNSVYETERLNDLLGIRKGTAYDKKTLYKRLGLGKEDNPEELSVNSMYQNNGYLFSRIDPGEDVVGADSIDINVKIFEGKQAKINEIDITGNRKVNDNVIRRELYVRPGELYNRSLLTATMRQLNQMQHFNPEKMFPDIQPVENSSELVNIAFPLEEVPSDKFEVSGGWGGGMFVASVGVQLNNISTKNFFKKGAWRPYPQGQGQQLAVRAQSNGSYYKAFSLNFTEPWLGGKKPNSLTIGLFYSNETNAYYAWQAGTKHFRTMGASLGWGRRLKWPDRNFSLYHELTYQAYNLKDWSSFIVQNGTSNIIALKTVFSRNTIDSPIYPRSGSEFSIALALTPPYSLFQKDVDYADPNLSENKRYKWIEYHKWELKAQWFYPLTNNNKLVFMAKAEMGYLGSYNKNKLSPFEGFDVGGDGMSGYNVYGVDIIGMRGYEDGGLTPYSYTADGRTDYARAYNKYTMEVRYPIILKPSSNIYALVFAEGGNAFKSWQEFDPFLIKRSVGVGLRIFMPVIGLLGVDWGYGFDKAARGNGRSGSQIHFMIGSQF